MNLLDANGNPIPSPMNLFSLLRHEALNNACTNWIADMKAKGESGFQGAAKQLLNDIEPHLDPAESELDDDLLVMLDSMADDDANPYEITMDPDEWFALGLRVHTVEKIAYPADSSVH
ncbi:hypothetical protein [Neptuniibacter sp. QD37_11]|uniref:hypothetical protein n=1 Tax=Neptuniibacter sp. QD37_11 TaxID=3398209 RepID=UPI0039F56B56